MKVVSLLVVALCLGIVHGSNMWDVLGDPQGKDLVRFRFALYQQNTDAFEDLVNEISNPKSDKYTEFLTIDEMMDILAPPKKVSQAVVDWLYSSCQVDQLSLVINQRDSIKVEASVDCVEYLLGVNLKVYKHKQSHYETIKVGPQSNDPVIPPQFRNVIQFVSGLFVLPELRKTVKDNVIHSNFAPIENTDEVSFNYIIPDTLRRLYNIPAGTKVTDKKATQTVIEFLPVGHPGISDLQEFSKQAGEVFNNITKVVGPWEYGSDGESTLDIQYITTLGAGSPTWYITIGDGWMYDYAVEVFNMEDAPLVHSISYGWPEDLQCGSITRSNCTGVNNEQYVKRANVEFAKLAGKGLSIIVCAQDEGAPSEANIGCNLDDTHPLWPIYPPASPWVTAVSGTTLEDTNSLAERDVQLHHTDALPPICNHQYTCDTTGKLERPCMENNTYYRWTTGGGFSKYAPRPKYQEDAVKEYLSSGAIIPPKKWFNEANRGYPDIAALGSRILIVEDGQISVTAGTSAATPIIAAIVTLLNNHRMSQGKHQLGFINHLLYQMRAEHPAAFNAIIAGNNKCTLGTCCEYGYGAAWNWDPVTGLGTPNYSEMIKYIDTLAK